MPNPTTGIGISVKRIEELEAELEQLKEQHRHLSPTWEKLLILVLSGVVAIAQSWVSAGSRVAQADEGLAVEETEVKRDAAAARASHLYDEAEAYFVAGDEQGCNFEDLEVK
jgi:hypothetical protein